MRITKRQLRKIIKEACGLGAQEELPPLAPPAALPLDLPMVANPMEGVPVPEDYDRVRDFLEVNPAHDLTISAIKQAAGTGCERSTAQGIIDHLADRGLG